MINCLGENTKKYITFLVPIKKVINTDKAGNKSIKIISYKIKFIDSFRFMSTSLSNLVDNLSEGLHNNKCKDCKSCLEYIKVKNGQFIFECLKCKKKKKKHNQQFHKDLIENLQVHMNSVMETLINLVYY